MAVAKILPEPEMRGRGNKSSVPEEFSSGRISMARTVLKWAPELAKQVLSADLSLDAAYQSASNVKLQAEGPQKRLEALRVRDPDLADSVMEDTISLDDAEGAAAARRQRERAIRQGTYDSLEALERYLFVFQNPPHRAALVEIVRNHSDEIKRDKLIADLTVWIDSMQTTLEMLNER